MKTEEFKFLNKSISIEEKELGSSFKIKSYKQKLKLMKMSNIPQKPIKDVIEFFFSDENKILSQKTKESVSKIIFSSKDRIIITLSKFGKEIIRNRDNLISETGWFFFVIEDEKKLLTDREKKKGSKKVKKEEKTLSVEQYNFEDTSIVVKQKENMRGLYKTKEYFKYFKTINSKKIPQIPIKEVIEDIFSKNKLIPLKEKKAIKKIIYYQKEKVIVVKSLIGDKMYESLNKIVQKYGWYFYITGVPVGNSEVSIAVDKIEKRFDNDYFKSISLVKTTEQQEKINVTLYPLALKPNHNSLILRLGNLNILLDCGITEKYFEYISNYLENYDDLIKETENSKKILADFESGQEKSTNIEELLDFELKKNEGEEKEEFRDEPEKAKENVLSEDENLNSKNLSVDSIKPKLDAIFISHSHFDHVQGLKDLISLYPDVPILCSRITLDLYMLRDSNFLKQELQEEIEEEEYRNVIKNVIYVENGDKIEFKDKNCYLMFSHAGHMPGALMLLAKAKDYRFLFTGDYTYWDYTPFAGTRRFLEQISRPIDFLLIDSACANEDFGVTQDQFHSLILFLEQKAEYGDNSLIGADPSSLAISFLLTIWRHFRKLQLKKDYKKRPNIYVDMMVRKNIQVINHRYEYIYGPISKLIRDKANPFNSIKLRWFERSDLDFLRSRNNIIISHPPDLSYGIIRNIINIIGRSPHNLVFLSGAIHEEPGLNLIEGAEEIEFSETWKMPFRALLLNKFSPQLKIKLHGDKTQLIEMIKNLDPKEVCFFHQSPKKLLDVAEDVRLLGVDKVSVPTKRKIMILN
jgi:Cft2 family RNA processing exonuclease